MTNADHSSFHLLCFLVIYVSPLRSHLSQSSLLLALPVMRPAMDPSQHAFHHHLARALMHLNQLASFLPSFEFPAEWDSTSGAPRPFPHHQPFQFSRQLHRFVPLPTDTRPPPSLASHGDLPSHFVMSPEPHFHPVIHRETHPTALNLNRETTYEDIHMVDPRTFLAHTKVTVRPHVPNKHVGPLHHNL